MKANQGQSLHSPTSSSHPPRRYQPKRTYRTQVLEVTTQLGVNLVLGGFAAVSLIHLIPYQLKQQAKLQTLQAEVKSAQSRVDLLQAQYQNSLNPQTVSQIVEQQNNLIRTNQRKIVWVEPKPSSASAEQ
jgi:uncharacterized protein YpmB